MNPTNTVMLAGKLDELGDSLLGTLGDWGDNGLKVALTVLVLAAIVRQFSVKAAIGAVLGLIVVLSLYAARNELAAMFSDEVKNPANVTGSSTLVVSPRATADGRGGVL
ncbi:hypothetical protein ACE1OC_43065 (plasmid) [Streptomyces sp. DSM 116496]|uniref:hypothetical protein n=1 Tax=Streptomyces stoeckheimensis TaxID=3344656 RepID=UPI0038B3851E